MPAVSPVQQCTKHDVLLAWFLKGAYATFPSSNAQGPNVYNTLNYRPFLNPLPPNQLYLHNSMYSFRTSSQFQSMPLYRIAHEIRLTVVRNKQPSIAKSALQFWEQNPNASAVPISPNNSIISYWTMFEYNSLDFSAALTSGGGTGRVVYTQPGGRNPFGTKPKPFMISVKDGRGGYWMWVDLLGSWWDEFSAKGEGDKA